MRCRRGRSPGRRALRARIVGTLGSDVPLKRTALRGRCAAKLRFCIFRCHGSENPLQTCDFAPCEAPLCGIYLPENSLTWENATGPAGPASLVGAMMVQNRALTTDFYRLGFRNCKTAILQRGWGQRGVCADRLSGVSATLVMPPCAKVRQRFRGAIRGGVASRSSRVSWCLVGWPRLGWKRKVRRRKM